MNCASTGTMPSTIAINISPGWRANALGVQHGTAWRSKATAHSADRRKYMLLVTGFLSELLELHLQLADEVERELADDAQ
jgi:hypothetical protein